MKIEKILLAGLFLLRHSAFGQAPGEIKGYLKNKDVSIAAKDFYSGKFKASDDERTLSILDSLKTQNNATRPFYIYLVSIMMDKSDGALSEALGMQQKNLLNIIRTRQLIFCILIIRYLSKNLGAIGPFELAGNL